MLRSRSASVRWAASPLEPSATTPSTPPSRRYSRKAAGDSPSEPSGAKAGGMGGKPPRSQAASISRFYGLAPSPRRLHAVRGVLALGALFVVAFVLTRANANAGFFLFLAVVCVGVVLVSLFARGLQQFGGTLRSRTGGSERDLVLGGLLLITLLTPWAVGVPTLGFRQIFGWQSPLALLAVVALVAARLPRARRLAVPALLVAGLGMVAWAAWATAQPLTPAFRHSGFGFLPIDLIGEGWYIALL